MSTRCAPLCLRGGGIAGFQRWFTSEFPEAVINVYDGDGDTDVVESICWREPLGSRALSTVVGRC